MDGVCLFTSARLCSNRFCEEYTWSRKAEAAREEELSWRVKANVVSTFMSFIWYLTRFLPLRPLELMAVSGLGYLQRPP